MPTEAYAYVERAQATGQEKTPQDNASEEHHD